MFRASRSIEHWPPVIIFVHFAFLLGKERGVLLLWLKIRRTEPVGLAGSVLIWALAGPSRGVVPVRGFGVAGALADMWRAEHTVFAVIAFIAALMLFMVYWHRAGDVSQAKPEADCHKAGGVWDSKMNMCMEATVSP
jgi:hypothetical protein